MRLLIDREREERVVRTAWFAGARIPAYCIHLTVHLTERRKIPPPAHPPALRLSEHLEGDGDLIFAHACRLGLEGARARPIAPGGASCGRR
jgi:hypothetical protein